jgi:Leucine-rich repeat (LRR) protein
VPDNNLRTQLNKNLSTALSTVRKDDQKITDVELEKLTDLNLDAADNASEVDKIHDLTGLEAAKNLKTLSLKNNSVFDLRVVSNIKSLKSINLTINR